MSPVLRRLARFATVPAFLWLATTSVRAEDPEPAAPTAAPTDAPTDAPAPAASAAADKRWMLKFSRGPLQRILVDDGAGVETTYMYMLFTVSNDTAFARPWYPVVTATVDTRKERPYYAGGYPVALERIRKKADDPALQSVELTWGKGEEGKIKAGETKKLVAIFGPVDPGWSSFHIEFHGLVNPLTTLKAYKYSDTSITYTDPVYVEHNAAVIAAATKAAGGAEVARPAPEYHIVVEKRVWAVDYSRKGDEFRPDDDPIEFVGERWKVLGSPKFVRAIK